MTGLSFSRMTVGFAVAGVVMSACGKSSPGSPVAPSLGASTISQSATPTPPSTPAAVSTGAQIVGSVIASSTGTGSGLRALSTGLTVRVTNTSIEGIVEASGHFELDDVPEGDVELEFTGPGVAAKLTVTGVTAHEHIDIAVTVTGATAAFASTQRAQPDSTIDLTGTITSIAASSLRVGDVAIAVSSTTTIRRDSKSVSLSDLYVGDKVKVHGSADGSVVRAAQIDAEPEATVSGTVAGLAGTCPSLTFNLDATAVATSASTTYGGGSACGDVKNGDKRVAIGPGGSGRLMARYVTGADRTTTPTPPPPPPPPPAAEVTLTGASAGLSGSCPNLTFTIGGTAAAVGASTSYGGTSACSDVKNGDTRGAAGTKIDGRLVIRYLSGRIETTPPVPPAPSPTANVTITGIIGGLAGSCPTLTFTVDGYPAVTSAATTFGGGSACGVVKNGDKRTVVGTKTDGHLVAIYVTGAI
jgi:hypothetical protein